MPFKAVPKRHTSTQQLENVGLSFKVLLRCAIEIPVANMFHHHQRFITDFGDSVVAHKKTSSPEAKELTEFVHVIGCNWSVLVEMNCIVFFSRCRFVFLCCFQSSLRISHIVGH